MTYEVDNTRRRNKPKKQSLIGARVGHWEVIDEFMAPKSYRVCVCRCICGAIKQVLRTSLERDASHSCGCRQYAAKRTHGMTNSIEYKSWVSMRTRCYNPNTINFKIYGGRGISVCERWMKFENFLADMGKRPSIRHSLDRIDVNGNYEPSNCRWATDREQCSNRRTTRQFEFRGKRMTLDDLLKIAKVERHTLDRRIRKGWSLEEAVTRGPMGRGPKRKTLNA